MNEVLEEDNEEEFYDNKCPECHCECESDDCPCDIMRCMFCEYTCRAYDGI